MSEITKEKYLTWLEEDCPNTFMCDKCAEIQRCMDMNKFGEGVEINE